MRLCAPWPIRLRVGARTPHLRSASVPARTWCRAGPVQTGSERPGDSPFRPLPVHFYASVRTGDRAVIRPGPGPRHAPKTLLVRFMGRPRSLALAQSDTADAYR